MKEGSGDPNKQKRPYLSPKATEVMPEQAEQLVKDRIKCSASEAKEILESLLRKKSQGQARETWPNTQSDVRRTRGDDQEKSG
ncbi:MAG: hypothetical protein JWQ87_5361 [Candidatus Sulfotelmatobacter sp.]|nr:hypothetical protein [Candidatus Sulfotelmatobacter sp.]